MNGTNTFSGRMGITDIIENRLKELFYENEVEIVPFGVLNIINNNEIFKNYFAKMEVNQKPASMIVKFAPDYIILKKTEPQELYFLEVKCSVTPCWSKSRVNKIKNRHGGDNIDESNIGEIAREALLSYNRFFPNTIVLYGSPYNSKILMAQFADKIQCLYCYKQAGEYDCDNCPSKNNGFFELERNTLSNGSQTANTNVNLDTFVSADLFFEQLGIHLKRDSVSAIQKVICDYNVRFPEKLYEYRKNEIRNTLVKKGCPWVESKLTSSPAANNAFGYVNMANENNATYYPVTDEDLYYINMENANNATSYPVPDNDVYCVNVENENNATYYPVADNDVYYVNVENENNETYYSAADNAFYHSTKKCFTLNGKETVMYNSEQEAIQNGKRRCKFC